MRHFDTIDFESMFGAAGPLPDRCLSLIKEGNWGYTPCDPPETSPRISLTPAPPLAGSPIARKNWYIGWSKILREYKKTGNIASLRPHYLTRPSILMRYAGEFIEPVGITMQSRWYDVFLRYLIETSLKDHDTIYEFGCGSGYNLATMATLYPDKYYQGLDWAPAAVATCNLIGKYTGLNVRGRRFNFFGPNDDYRLAPDSVVLTVGALEQTGMRWEPFIKYLQKSEASMFVHIEPIVEWYDPWNNVDQSAIRYHYQRGYQRGLFPYLQYLEHFGEIEILTQHRTGFGSQHTEGYSQLMWRNRR